MRSYPAVKTLRSRLFPVITLGLMLCANAHSENRYLQHNLVSDIPGIADVTDPDLTNPWGISASPTSPLWISNNHSGTAKIYDGSGKPASLVVSVVAPSGAGPASPTGQVFNSTTAFVLPDGKTATFLFATEDGTIAGWYNGISGNRAATVVNKSGSGTVYKGLAIASPASGGPVLLNR